MSAMEKSFSRWKQQCLQKVDLSKKGGVDEHIRHVVSLLNGCEEFFTTSSCSGRIIVIDAVPDVSEVHKQNCVWLFVSHDTVTCEDLMCALSRSSGDAVLKFEPFVLHVQCRSLEDAQKVHSAAVNSGFRNSGLTVGRAGKIMSAVRSTHGLEVPLSHRGKLLVDQEYVRFLTQSANQKMEENLRRIQRFFKNFQDVLSAETVHVSETLSTTEAQEPKPTVTTESTDERDKNVYQRRRRRQREANGHHGDEDSCLLELEDGLGLFT